MTAPGDLVATISPERAPAASVRVASDPDGRRLVVFERADVRLRLLPATAIAIGCALLEAAAIARGKEAGT